MSKLDLTCPKCGAKDALRLLVTEEIRGATPFLTHFGTFDSILTYKKEEVYRVRSKMDRVYCRECLTVISDTPVAFFGCQSSEGKHYD